MRAQHLSLREVRGITFLLSGLIVAFISPVAFAKPTHAEGLLPTVRCLVQTVLLTGCPKPIPTDTSSPVVSPTQPSAPTQTTQSTPQSTTGNPPASSSGTRLASPAPVGSVEADTLETPQQLQTMPKVTQPTRTPHSFDYVAFFNTSSSYASPKTEGDGGGLIVPTQEGWKVAGLAWYWWIAMIGAITGVISLIRRWYIRRASLLSNPR